MGKQGAQSSANRLSFAQERSDDWAREITPCYRRGVFQDLEQLIMAIGDYIDRHNESPKPFIWTAKANDILEKSPAHALH